MKKFHFTNPFKKRKTIGEKIIFIVMFIIFLLLAAFILYFFVLAFLIAFRSNAEYDDIMFYHTSLFSWPKKFTLVSFANSFDVLAKEVTDGGSFWTLLFNSLWRTSIYVFLSSLTSAMVCYVLVFYRSKFTKVIYDIGILVSILPLFGSSAATLKLYKAINFYNNPIALVTSIGLYGGYFFYMYSFYKSLKWEYAEAALVDGAGHYRVFFRIMLPMVIPSIAVLVVMSFIGSWNDYESTILWMDKYPNLAYAVYYAESQGEYSSNFPEYVAAVLVSLVPILTLFLAFQNSIMEKVHLGGLKG